MNSNILIFDISVDIMYNTYKIYIYTFYLTPREKPTIKISGL